MAGVMEGKQYGVVTIIDTHDGEGGGMIQGTTVAGIAVADGVALTEKAAVHVRRLKEEGNIPETHGLRLSVKGGGCSGLSYVLGFDEQPKENDAVLEQRGIKVFIDPKSLFYLSGTLLDFSDGLNGKGFVFNNPQASRTCGCGSSFGV
jgi:iron-sulfur cluster assembly protein